MKHLPIALLCGAVLVAVVGLGGAQLWSVGVAAALLWLAGAAFLWPRRAAQVTYSRALLYTAGLAFFALGAMALLQLVPLPLGLLAKLGPLTARHYEESWRLAFDAAAPSPRALSVALSLSADRAARWLTLALGAWVGAFMLMRSPAQQQLRLGVLSVGGASALLGALNLLMAKGGFFGLYHAQIPMRSVSTFVNNNHSASLYGLCALVALIVMLRSSRGTQQGRAFLGYGLLSLIFLGLTIWHESRLVNLAVMVGAAWIILGTIKRSDRLNALIASGRMPSVNAERALLSVVITSGVIAVMLALVDGRLISALAPDALARHLMVVGALKLSASAWLMGTGAGSVGQLIYPQLDWAQLASATIPVAENELAEWAMTMGYPAAIIAASALWAQLPLSLPILDRDTGRISSSRANAVGLWCYMALIAMFHFPSFIMGVGLPALLVCGATFIRGQRREIEGAPSRFSPTARTTGAKLLIKHAMLGAVVAAAFALSFKPASPPASALPPTSSALAASLYDAPADAEHFAQLARDEIKAKRPEHAVRYAERAYALKPQAHLSFLLAHAQAEAGELEQAKATYTTLFHTFKTPVQPLWLTVMLHDLRDAEARAQVLLAAPEHLWKGAAELLLTRQSKDAAFELLSALIASAPHRALGYELLIRAYQRAGMHEVASLWASLMLEAKLEPKAPGEALAHRLLVESLVAQGLHEEAWEALQVALSAYPSDKSLLLLQIRSLPSSPDVQTITRVERAVQQLCMISVESDERFACTRAKAWLYKQRGEQSKYDAAILELLYEHADASALVQDALATKRCLKLKSIAQSYTRAHAKAAPKSPTARAVLLLDRGVKRCFSVKP